MTTDVKHDSMAVIRSDINLRIAVIGSVDSSKSTSVGVLMTGNLDNGRGSARTTVLKLPHEKQTGRSSSVSYNYIKQQCPDGSRRIVTMVDLCGHKQYLRTTLYGITAHRIDYGMVVVGSNMGINVMENGSFVNSVTAEHMNILHQLKIPFFIVMGKRDLCTGVVGSESQKCECLVANCACKAELLRNPEYQKTKKDIAKLLREMSYQPVWVDSLTTDALLESWTGKLVKMMNGTKFVPIIVTSNKTGFNINLLKNLMSTIPPRLNHIYDTPNDQSSTFFIEARYWKKGIGLIISGTLRGKTINIGDKLLLGPFNTTKDTLWHEIKIRGIHNNLRESLQQLTHGQTGCFAITCPEVDRKAQLRIGLVALSNREDTLLTTREFTAEIKVLNHSTSITNRCVQNGNNIQIKRYQAVIHCLNIRQSASMYMPVGDILRSGESKIVGFKFIKQAEHLEIGADFLFCEGKTRGIGRVTAFGLPDLNVIAPTPQSPALDNHSTAKLLHQ